MHQTTSADARLMHQTPQAPLMLAPLMLQETAGRCTNDAPKTWADAQMLHQRPWPMHH